MEKLNEILSLLKKHYGKPKTALKHKNPFQLLVATILSAQCTDKRVNIVTPKLFSELPDAKSFSETSIDKIETLVKSTGFYKNKAKNIKAASEMIINDFGGKVPDNMEDLLKLPGVARKTANIILGHAFGKTEGIAIDTHCIRLCNRFGWVDTKNAVVIERELMKEVDKKDWTLFTNLLIDHGRSVCTAKKPNCEECFLNKICVSAFRKV
tara:strand:- start:2149 stop:2778 length:630 start_codon:yes stop_codon:yes gene_type:complete